jgi:hypothetical protein
MSEAVRSEAAEARRHRDAEAASEGIWEAIQRLQDKHISHTEIIDALLWEAGWMIEVVASGEADANKTEIQRLVSEFSEICAGLIEQPRDCRRDRH